MIVVFTFHRDKLQFTDGFDNAGGNLMHNPMRSNLFLNEANELPIRKRKTGSKHGIAQLACALIGLLTVSTAMKAQSITQLFSFPCPNQQFSTCSEGYAPNLLIQASDGNFYGAAQLSTIGSSNPHGGTLFKITPAGQFTKLFTFTADSNGNYVNGDNPATGLVEANDGFLYGSSFEGGTRNGGVLFRISKKGTGFKVLHNFCSAGSCADGSTPESLLLGHDGKLYGVTLAGGSNSGNCGVYSGCGTIFCFTPPATLTTLFAFDGSSSQGAGPFGLTQGADGNFYGVAGGEVFRFTLGEQLTVLKNLPPVNGFLPTHASNRLLQARSGKLYGALSTYSLAQLQFYEIDPSGKGFMEFASLGNDLGANGVPALIQASDGNLWDEPPGLESVVAISPADGSVLKSFPFNGANGSFPDAPVVQAAEGKLYGTAVGGGIVSGGQQASGTVWTLDAGLSAPASVVSAFTPATGAVGSKVLIRGDHFVGTKAVTFNGVNAIFKVLNVNFVSATVPAGASSGPIAVSNDGGTTVSTGHFTVE